MESIETLESTTFSGRRFTRKQLAQIQETVKSFPNLSRKELAITLCEHLHWASPNGAHKIPACLTLLEKIEQHGVITLPAARKTKKPQHAPARILDAPHEPAIEGTLEDMGSIELRCVKSEDERERWKTYLKKYHYLGYRHSVGQHLGYIIHSKTLDRDLGCILFSGSPTLHLPKRDEWIGWELKHRKKLLHLVVNQSRFLIFPWVKVPNLASKVLSLSKEQISDDWLRFFSYRPVLLETFVDTTKYEGTCYQAANWVHVGQTTEHKRTTFTRNHAFQENVKDIYFYPLTPDFRHRLTHDLPVSAQKKRYRNDVRLSHSRSVDDGFVKLWEKVSGIVRGTAAEYDEKWRIRKRLIDSMLLILFIFRLVLSKNRQGYGATLDELWDSAKKLDIPLPQKSSITPSSFCEARKKLDEEIFRGINHKIIEIYEDKTDSQYLWLGHRLFAVDGSKINLPRALLESGYSSPSKNAHYPQGLLSCLYQLKSKIPYDFDLFSHTDERMGAEKHLRHLRKGDVVVYDRGYFSYFLFHQHQAQGVHAIFRMQENTFTVINQFIISDETDKIVTIDPSTDTKRDIRKKHPNIQVIPLQIRLIKYQIQDTQFVLGTTLFDAQYTQVDFSDVYHSRWGIEELYKISKHIVVIEEFHAKSERGVRQELFAHFALITMNRIFANQADIDINSDISPPDGEDLSKRENVFQTNFKACAQTVTRSMEALLCFHDKVRAVVSDVYEYIVGRYQVIRRGRSYERKSMKPIIKWRPQKKKAKKRKCGSVVQVPS